jgi:hypothetical protein
LITRQQTYLFATRTVERSHHHSHHEQPRASNIAGETRNRHRKPKTWKFRIFTASVPKLCWVRTGTARCGGVAGGIDRLNQQLVAAYQLPEITPSKREKRQASEQVKEFVEGVILSLSTESIIRWNPPGEVLTGWQADWKQRCVKVLSWVTKRKDTFAVIQSRCSNLTINSIQMQQLDY